MDIRNSIVFLTTNEPPASPVNSKNLSKIRNELNKVLLQKYKKDVFIKYKQYAYINRKKAETDLARNIKNKFGKDVILIEGDLSDKLKTTPSIIKYILTNI